MREAKKILIIGLENSGKTTILISLKKDVNLMSFVNLKPTRGINIENIEGLDEDLIIWDFGGQLQYREEYLNNFYKYTESISNLIFVIDVQAIDKYEDAINYLENIVNLLNRERLLVDISIFLHKLDPNLQNLEKFKNIHTDIQERLLKPIENMIPKSYSFKIFKTTIFTVFEKDLLMERDNKKKKLK